MNSRQAASAANHPPDPQPLEPVDRGTRDAAGPVLEVAVLDVRVGQETAFEKDFLEAAQYIRGTSGYVTHELQRCIEKPSRYILLVRWQTLQAHTEGFRKSESYLHWKRLLHHYYDPFPTVEHYTAVYATATPRH